MRKAAAGANTVTAEYLGQYATVMDAEMLGITMSFEAGHVTVALDSQGAITRAAGTAIYIRSQHGRGLSIECRRP